MGRTGREGAVGHDGTAWTDPDGLERSRTGQGRTGRHCNTKKRIPQCSTTVYTTAWCSALQHRTAEQTTAQGSRAMQMPSLTSMTTGLGPSPLMNVGGGTRKETSPWVENITERWEGECHKPWRRKKITCNAWVLVSVPSEGIPPIIFPLGPQALSQGPLPPHPRLSNHVCLLPSLSTAPPTLSSPHSLSCPSPSRHPSHQ